MALQAKKINDLSEAKRHLRRAHAIERQYDQQLGQLDILEQAMDRLHSLAWNTQMVEAMAVAEQALKEGRANLSVDDAHRAREAMHDEMECADEITDALAASSISDDLDDDDLLAELDGWEEDDKSSARTATDQEQPLAENSKGIDQSSAAVSDHEEPLPLMSPAPRQAVIG
uniref:Charged multivesicular body protein 7 n=1 Tax=Octactis speculum TaxID=3111310 RepID=A0A7S2FJR9_9STRA|mmetsp:Transcript_23389/g.31975  ORF Transcript_23389/g.31975 Transcript_23389/m.31975 type:complete len:172 (+) Transcript_23389:310-825(+)